MSTYRERLLTLACVQDWMTINEIAEHLNIKKGLISPMLNAVGKNSLTDFTLNKKQTGFNDRSSKESIYSYLIKRKVKTNLPAFKTPARPKTFGQVTKVIKQREL